ncbi:hypothetical protein Q4555_05015 [Octadecabacter sp. 1_MG-2023]|uniref:hypothetical protein n=1 Tax=unclassified Octadecabacter TaxID=196158 RepID=UPI001C098F72|nr:MULTISPECIES: hypothetical protein [unclassified Octadecabacter]MBU2994690.1 hypothetical protein [Octadecabacter sp. B2R22]MDO6734016.1 hypothetical protein [Octadecabacter sp. 1_MG-2023]
MSKKFEYQTKGRSKRNVSGLIFTLRLAGWIVFDTQSNFHWLILVVLVGFIAQHLWPLIRNPIYGMAISDDVVTIGVEGEIKEFALEDIKYVKVAGIGGGGITLKAHLKNGETVKARGPNLPAAHTLRKEFRSLGIDVRSALFS